MCMFVSEICAEGIFVTFPWWLKSVKSWSKIALFSNKRHFEIWFPKKRTSTFFWSKLSKLYKKDPILHVSTIFSLKQGETRSSHGPIPPPLRCKTVINKRTILPDSLWACVTIIHKCKDILEALDYLYPMAMKDKHKDSCISTLPLVETRNVLKLFKIPR